jgi:hypothetical protein
VLDRRLRRDKYSPHVDGQRAIEVRQRKILERTHNRDSRVVDENVNTAKFRYRAFYGGDHGTGMRDGLLS